AWPAFHRYHDELHVPERGLVVLLDAHPILSDLSPALLGSAPFWAVYLFTNGVCTWIFRALPAARGLSPAWLLGPGRLRHLPTACILFINLTSSGWDFVFGHYRSGRSY